MKKKLFILSILFLPLFLFGQEALESNLINGLLAYDQAAKNSGTEEDNPDLRNFTHVLQETMLKTDLENLDKFKQTIDTLNFVLEKYKSEKGDFILYHLSSPTMYHWNYIINDHQIVLEDNRYHQYFTEIHNLNQQEFLLISQMDELVFSCNYATVFRKKKNIYVKKTAFGKKAVLTVCNFTHVEDGKGHYSLPLKRITFDYANKTISYGLCTDLETGEKKVGKSAYLNGKFNIKDCDERQGFTKIE